jgi:dolichol kinase
MIQSDILGVLLVYLYVAFLLIFSEKVLSKQYPLVGRKLLHILVGNIAFLLPIFETREIMAFLAAGPFILFTYLMSPYSPLSSIRGKTSQAGHGLGLVYYAISWTVLGYFFFDHKEIIAIAILAMSYGDGLASLIGLYSGKRTYHIYHDVKSYLGSLSMFVFTLVTMMVALVFYQVSFTFESVTVLSGIAFLAAMVEGLTPLGLDNLSVPFISALLYWWVFVV